MKSQQSEATVRLRSLFVSVTLLMVSAVNAVAQTETRGYVIGGVARGTDDKADRLEYLPSEDSNDPLWFVAGAVQINNWFGVGWEVFPFQAVSTELGSKILSTSQHETEQLIVGTVRGRVPIARALALDVIGGIGTMRQHLQRFDETHFPGDIPYASNVSQVQYTAAFVAGVDFPIAAAPHLTVVPMTRLDWLQRKALYNLPLPQNSTRFIVGIGGAGFRW